MLDGQSQLNLKQSKDCLIFIVSDLFVKTGHGMTDVVIHCTEFQFQHATNLDLNSLIFSNYKNTVTGKALAGISPHVTGLLYSAMFSCFNK